MDQDASAQRKADQPRGPARRTTRLVQVAVVLLALVATGLTAADAQPTIPDGPGVLLVTQADGTILRLDGAEISDEVVVWLDPAVGATAVRFYVGPERNRYTLFSQDRSAPFHLAEDGNEPVAIAASELGSGSQTIFATYRDARGWHHVRHEVTIGEDRAPSPQAERPERDDPSESDEPSAAPESNGPVDSGRGVLVAADGSGNTVRLDGATIAGPVTISLDPAIPASEVVFYVGSDRNRYTVVNRDHRAPFVLDDPATVGPSLQLDPGRHTVWATYRVARGWLHERHQFTVSSSTASVPTPETPIEAPPIEVPTPETPIEAPPVEVPDSDLEALLAATTVPSGAGVLLATDAQGRTTRLIGTDLEGPLVVWLDPAVGAAEVRFYVGPRRDREFLVGTDQRPPFVLGQAAGGDGYSELAELGATVFATYRIGGGWYHARHAVGGTPEPAPAPPTPAPAPDPTPAQPQVPSPPRDNDGPTIDPPEVASTDIVVAPGASGAGTIADPASLVDTLESRSIAAGTTVWLRGGTYVVSSATSRSDGTADRPIVFRPFPGEHAVIDGDRGRDGGTTVRIEGDYQTWTELELTNSNRQRYLGTTGSQGRPTLLSIVGRGTAIINNSIHDGGVCIGWWKTAVDSIVYGNLIYDCGWNAPDRGHGPGIYIQNLDDGRKLLEANLVGSTYERSMKTVGSDQIHNIDVFDNVFAGGHSLADEYKSPVYFDGGVTDVNFTDNHVYTRRTEPVSFVGVGGDFTFDRNYLMVEEFSLGAVWHRRGQDISGRGNHMVAPRYQMRIEPGARFGDWDANTYYGSDLFYPTRDLAGLRDRYGIDRSSRVVSGLPSHVAVTPNRYDDDRGLVTIWNGALADTVSVDVSSILEPGDRYVVLGGQDLGGQPLLEGTYRGGPLAFPMVGRSVGAPIGGPAPEPWGQAFGAFVILPQAS